jgi:hypothetical protein
VLTERGVVAVVNATVDISDFFPERFKYFRVGSVPLPAPTRTPTARASADARGCA